MAKRKNIAKAKDDIAYVIGDFGNVSIKAMLLMDTYSKISYPYKMLEANALWPSLKAQSAYHTVQTRNTVYLKHGDVCWIIGEGAEERGSAKAFVGTNKYSPGIFPPVVLSTLMQFFPEGHDNISLFVAYPVSAVHYLGDMLDVLIGEHKVETLDGRVLTYVIREITPWKEPVAGVNKVLSNYMTQPNGEGFMPGDKILVMDAGGGISSVTMVELERDNAWQINVWEDPQLSPAVPYGILDVFSKLSENLFLFHSEQMRVFTRGKIPLRLLEMVLLKRQFQLGGRYFPVEDEVLEHSVYVLLDPFEGIWRNNHNSGAQINHVVFTGGAMRAFGDYMDEVIGHPHIIYAHERPTIHYANLFGGNVMAYAKLVAMGRISPPQKSVPVGRRGR